MEAVQNPLLDTTPETPVAGPSTAPTAPAEGATPLSKNAQKRAAKRAHYESVKLEKRAAEKIRRRERQAYLTEGYAAGTLSTEDAALVDRQRALKRARKASSRGSDAAFGGAVVVDLGFDELMTDQEISSMNSQLGYVYSINRTSKVPFGAVLHTGFGPTKSPRLWEKMAKSTWNRWSRMHFWEEDIDVLAKVMKEGAEAKVDGAAEVDGDAGAAVKGPVDLGPTDTKNINPDELIPFLSGPNLPPSIPATHKLVYLSADADEELTTLADDEVYIIGGIVDRNRHKMLCQNKADRMGIRTARLPIGTYLADLPTRKVLTVNQVFEILTQYLALKDWAAAFEAVIPQRKYFSGKSEKSKANKAKGAAGDAEGDGDEDEEEDEAEEDDEESAANGQMDVDDEEAAMNA